MEDFKINISSDFNNKLGGRFIRIGTYSGEAFYEKLLEPQYLKAVKANEKLHIYLDGASPYGSSFLDQSFGKLGRTHGKSKVKEVIVLHSSLYEWIIDVITNKLWNEN